MTPSLLAALIPLALAACSVASAHLSAPAPALRVDCALHLTAAGSLISLRAEATSPSGQTGHWGLSVASRDGGVVIDQGGPVTLPAGQPVTLSELAFTGQPAALTAQLTLTVAGRTQDCPLQH